MILDACLHCYSVDPQIEGTRADFMLELVSSTPDRDFYREQVLNALPGSGDDWDAKQRFRFATCLALDGDSQAKLRMYESYNPGPIMGEAIGIDFVNLDGREGLLFAAEKIGKLLLTNPKGVDLGWLVSVSEDVLGKQVAREALKSGAAENPSIGVYFAAIQETEDSETRSTRSHDKELIKTATYAQFKTKLTPGRTNYMSRIWGMYAPDAELRLAADALVSATNEDTQIAHLQMFRDRPFPLDHSIFIELAKSSNERVQINALNVLAHTARPAARSLAFELIRTRAKWRSSAIELLANNLEPGDHETVLKWFEVEEQPETLHDESRHLLALWEAHPSEPLYSRMLLGIYERCPCSFCREKAVELLLQRNELPSTLREECAWDANVDIRELVKSAE